MPYAPLCGGMLTGKYERGGTNRDGNRAENDTKLQSLLTSDAAFDVIDQLRPIAAEHDVTLAQLAMLWLLAKFFVTTPIFGGSKLEHFRPMYEIADRVMSGDVVKRIDEISSGFVHRRFENQPVKEGARL